MKTLYFLFGFTILLFIVTGTVLFKRHKKIERLRNDSKYQTVPKEYLDVVDFFWTKYQLWLTHPQNTMSSITFKPKGLLLILLVLVVGLVCIELFGSSFFIVLIVGLTLSYFYGLEKEIAYFDGERLIDLRSANFLKTKCKRQDILFSEIERVNISTYSFKARRKIVFLFHLKNSEIFETFKIDMNSYGNTIFIDELTRKLKNLNLICN